MEDEALVTAAASLYRTSNSRTRTERTQTETYMREETEKRDNHHLVPFRNAEDVPITNQSSSYEDIKAHINNRALENSVFTKQIHQTDSVGDCLDLNEDFFCKEIVPSLRIKDEILRHGINVEVYDSKLRKYDMVLRGFGKSPTIINLHCWNELRQDNDFAAGMKVEISVYRDALTRKLCFAIYKILE